MDSFWMSWSKGITLYDDGYWTDMRKKFLEMKKSGSIEEDRKRMEMHDGGCEIMYNSPCFCKDRDFLEWLPRANSFYAWSKKREIVASMLDGITYKRVLDVGG